MKTLREAAQAVCDRWDTPLWKDAAPTAVFIGELREAIAAEEAQAVEPVDIAELLESHASLMRANTASNLRIKELEGERRVYQAQATEPANPDYAELERIHLGDADKNTGIYAQAKPSACEREALIQKLRDYGSRLAAEAADMLAADAVKLDDCRRINHMERNRAHRLIAEIETLKAQQVAVPPGLDADTLRDMAGAAFEEAMAFGISTDSFERLARTVNKCAISAAPQPPQADEPCHCDKQGIGKPSVTCRDCHRDYQPTQAAPRVPMTEFQTVAIYNKLHPYNSGVSTKSLMDFVAEIEANHGIGVKP